MKKAVETGNKTPHIYNQRQLCYTDNMADKRAKSHRTGNEVVREDGRIEYEYSDGAWRFSNGHLARRHPGAVGFTSETGTSANEGRYERVRKARDRALIEAARHLKPGLGISATVEDAAALITKAQFELATSPDWAGASTGAAKYLDKTANFIQESTKEQHNSLTIVMTDANAIDTLKRIADKAIAGK